MSFPPFLLALCPPHPKGAGLEANLHRKEDGSPFLDGKRKSRKSFFLSACWSAFKGISSRGRDATSEVFHYPIVKKDGAVAVHVELVGYQDNRMGMGEEGCVGAEMHCIYV